MINLLFAAMNAFCYINAPVVDMREQPAQDSEIVSQGYFSEEVTPLEEAQNWVKIETAVDHYQGWVQKGSFCQRKEAFSPSLLAKVNRAKAHLYHVQDTVYGPIATLPFESRLEVLEPKEESNSRWIKVSLADGREAYIQRGDITLNPSPLNKEQMIALSLKFLDLPYTWGGRSSFGYDCSGFVQMLYRQMGIHLPRDSKDQMKWDGFVSISLDALQPGDLIFFGLAEDKIRHVGMYLADGNFIHSTVAENMPYLRISNMKDQEWNGSGRFTFRAGRRLN